MRILLLTLLLLTIAESAPASDATPISAHPPAADYSFFQSRVSTASFVFDASKRDGFQMDLRSCDLSAYDLAKSTSLPFASFNTRTVFPKALPRGFDPTRELELGKNPGLGLRALHAAGVTGKGVGIAVLDQALLTEHAEYADRLRLYEEIHCLDRQASMHGPATASIAAGRNVGVAPEADLYFIGMTNGSQGKDGEWEFDLGPIAQGIDRVVSVNKSLPAGRKIRVISISLAMVKTWKNYDRAAAAIAHAEKDGILVLTVGNDVVPIDGLGRDPASDPDSAESYGPGLLFAGNRGGSGAGVLEVPMDSRTIADPTGPNAYTFLRAGGQSWIVPWTAGLYALACQVRPGVTPALFREAAFATARPVRFARGGKTFTLEKVVDPAALIAKLQADAD